MQGKNNLEVCFSPKLFPDYENHEANVVVVDILRATSAIVTAFMNGVSRLIPVGTLEEAKEYKEKGYMVAAERDGIVRDFADFGNSPYNFTRERVAGKDIVYSTTNGTQSIMMAKECNKVLIGAYLNLSALVDFLVNEGRDVTVFCAGWKNKFSLEDSLFAGVLCKKLLQTKHFYTICDSVHACLDMWDKAEPDVMAYIQKAAQRERLRKNGLDDVLEYCHTPNLTSIIPYLEDKYLVKHPER